MAIRPVSAAHDAIVEAEPKEQLTATTREEDEAVRTWRKQLGA